VKQSQIRVAIAVTFVAGFCSRLALAQLAGGEPTRLFEMRNWVVGLDQPTDIAFVPDGRAILALRDGELVVRTRDGALHHNAGNTYPKLRHLESGLLGIAMIPDAVVDNGMGPEYPLVTISAGIDNNNKEKIRINTGRLLANNEIFIQLARPLLELSPRTAGHYGGGLVVQGDDLYVSIGDSSILATPPTNRNASCLNHPYGKILRIKLDGSVPADNPLVGMTEVSGCDGPTDPIQMMPPDRRIFAWGLRNPWRFWVDPMTKLLWIGDVGERTREEISIGGAGHHFGYPFFEGGVSYDQAFSPRKCEGLMPSVSCTPPAFEWTNGRAIGGDRTIEDRAAIGGLIPDETGTLCGWPPDWKGRYFFGDFGSGLIRTVGVAPDRRSIVSDDVSTFGTVAGVTGFRMGFDNALYVVSNGSGSIVRVISRDHTGAGCTALPAPIDAAVVDVMDASVLDPSDAAALSPMDSATEEVASIGNDAAVVDAAVVDAAVDAPAGDSDGAVGTMVSSPGGCSCQLDRGTTSGFAFGLAVFAMFFVRGLRRRGR
jgi:aldose sugar dehydrogenase